MDERQVNAAKESDEAKKQFERASEIGIASILDNLIDRANTHGVTIAHDSAVPDGNDDGD
jgi:hypothetical protein